MENINNNKIQSNQNKIQSKNNYNNNIVDNSSKNYIFDFDSLFNNFMNQKNKDANVLNQYHCNLLMIYFDQILVDSKLYLIKFLFYFNTNTKDDNYKYYIFKKLTKVIEKSKQQELITINFSKFIDILIERSKFLAENGNYFYSYYYLYNELYKDIPNITKARRIIKEKLIEDNQNMKEFFAKLTKNDYRNIYNKLKEMIKNEINPESNEILYVINNNWLINAINFVKNILSKESNELDADDIFRIYDIYQKYFGDNNNNINNETNSYTYPGKINNYIISDFKDIWRDPVNEDENYLLKDNISFFEDYSLVNENNWSFINELFKSTNEIKRKRNNLQLIKLKVVILDKRFLRNHSNLLRTKYIQTNLKINIKEFKEKILRCINHSLNCSEEIDNMNLNEITDDGDIIMTDRTGKLTPDEDRNLMNNNNNDSKDMISFEDNIESINFNFFKIKKLNKSLLIEMFTAYKNELQKYESVYIEKLDLKDENKLLEIINFFNKSTDILIIELTPNTSSSFLYPIQNDIDGLYQCSTCHSKISFREKYICERCNFSIYCSQKCLESELQKNNIHTTLHQYLKEYQIKNENNISTKNINSTNLVGLINLGNTCFINSSLQCLFHTKELTNYFLNDIYLKEINTQNAQGSRGKIAEGFAELLKQMQKTNNTVLNPINFLRTFFRINQSLNAGIQHDAQEFLSILLDYLHEDLNRINKKPYIQLEEQKENETDKEASERFWNSHKKREDSIIVDLFHGQFKSKITCEKCSNISINYEPFIFLGLPIPEKKNRMIIKFALMNKLEYFGFDLDNNPNVFDLKKKAVEHMKMCGYNNDINNDILYNHIEFVLLDENKIIKKIFNNKNKLYDNELITDILKDNKNPEIILYEKKLDQNYFNIYVYPIKQNDYDSTCYPISLSVKGDMTFSEIIKQNRQKILNMYVNIDDNENIHVGVLHKKNNSWTYYITNIFDSREYCPVCKNSEDNFCLLNDNIQIEFLLNRFKDHEPILFVMGTPKKKVLNKIMRINENLENGIYFLNDCLKFFCEEELLNNENMWYCNQCKKHKKAKKQIKLYKMPKYLIIQLKKFENKVGFFNSINEKKKEVFIKYPINNLDLSDFIENEEQKKYKYDLYAVIQHHGKINEGHYTAICNINDNWVLYNDSQLFKMDNPVTDDAYILFYKRN